jgi:uncharacterized protein
MRLALASAAVALTAALGSPALAFNCSVPALFNTAKKTVCDTALLRAADSSEQAELSKVRGGFAIDSRRAINNDRRVFTNVVDSCKTDQLCLSATYRAQLRLYSKLAKCKVPANRQMFCVTSTIEKHRQELHNSM